jgi:2-amino-4-hydroxy-6-hydroxymethyldihydropteridine diphosphokinase
MSAPPVVFLGLGSNVGDREANLARARERLAGRGFHESAASALYETEPVGGPPQGAFLNQAIGGGEELAAPALLEACLTIEHELGRVRRERNGPRTLDLDILIYGDLVSDVPGLQIPHPRLHERRFVLVPLAEIAASFRHPVLGASVGELLARCPDTSRVARYQPSPVRG